MGAADAWQWDFGDGGTSAAQHPVYTYTTAGVFTVTLTVTDTDTAETDTLVETSYIQVDSPLLTTVINYEYDDLYRLTGATYTGAISATYDYAYDSVGNMTAFTETVTSTRRVERTFDAANQLITSFNVDAGTTSYTYDNNGNLTDVYPPGSDAQNPAGVLHYDYDQRNMLITHTTYVSGTGWVLQAAYVYDGANDRVQQVDYTGASPVTTTYTNDAVGLTQVLVADDGASQVYNLFGLDLIQQDGGSGVRTLLADGLGSVRLELAGGAVEAVTTYSPYGEVLEQSGTSGTVYGFTGEQEDSTTGLLYLRARYYNSSLKVFQSRDPWEGSGWRPETLNRYVYVGGDPVRFSDPFGLCRSDDPYDPYADTECLEIAAYLARRDPTNGFNTYAQFSTFTLAKRRDELILQDARTTGLVAIIEFFRVDGHGPASLRLERLLEKTDSFSFMGINFKTGLNFGIRIPGGASLCEDFEDKQFYASDGGFPEWQQVSRGADVQMSHFLSAVALAYYGLDNSPFSGAALARISTGVGPFSEADSSTSFSEFWNMSNDELAIRLIVGHEVVPDRRGRIGSRLANIEQLLASTDQQVRDFIQAVAYDVAGNQLQRDAHLNSIFNSNPNPIEIRPGNSLQDLRLSTKGWIFGHHTRVGLLATSNQAAIWLEKNLAR